MERNTYTPMGRKWTDTGSGTGATLATNRYRYNGKEEQTLAAGMPYTDYGARLFDPDHCTWLSPDPLSSKYPGVYPYAFCAGDPVNYVDPDGRKIHNNSQKRWDRYSKNLDKVIEKVKKELNSINNDDSRYDNLLDRLNGLNSIKETMESLKSSTQLYKLGRSFGNTGYIQYNSKSGMIKINTLGNISNFIHEMMHAGQFESGDIAFTADDGSTLAQDIYDELGAYKAEAYYNGKNASDITIDYIKTITDSAGNLVYSSETTNTALEKVTIYTNYHDVLKAYGRTPSINTPNIPLFKIGNVYSKESIK